MVVDGEWEAHDTPPSRAYPAPGVIKTQWPITGPEEGSLSTPRRFAAQSQRRRYRRKRSSVGGVTRKVRVEQQRSMAHVKVSASVRTDEAYVVNVANGFSGELAAQRGDGVHRSDLA